MGTYVSKGIFGGYSVNVKNAAEAKLAIKELRLLKKALGLEKRAITAKQKAIRAKYTDTIRRRAFWDRQTAQTAKEWSKSWGSWTREQNAASRNLARAQLASDLRPLEAQKQKIEKSQQEIDALILKLQTRY
jgi:hypothetical protein